MNTLENQRYNEIKKEIDQLKERLEDLENYVDNFENVENENPVIDINKKKWNEVLKEISYIELCSMFLNRFKGLWMERDVIDFTNFPINLELEKYFFPDDTADNEIKKPSPILKDTISNLDNLLKSLETIDENEIIVESIGKKPSEWFFEYIRKWHLCKTVLDKPNDIFSTKNMMNYDFIDLLCITYGVTEIFDHIYNNVLDSIYDNEIYGDIVKIQCDEYRRMIHEIYKKLYVEVVLPLENIFSI